MTSHQGWLVFEPSPGTIGSLFYPVQNLQHPGLVSGAELNLLKSEETVTDPAEVIVGVVLTVLSAFIKIFLFSILTLSHLSQ